MRLGSKTVINREIHSIVFVYALFGSAWIYLSDAGLSWLVSDPVSRSRVEVFKGLLFILFTSALLYHLIGRFARRNAEATKKLAESEARFQTIYHNVNDALLIHDAATGGIVDLNSTMCSMFGYSREEALQLQVQDLSSGESPYNGEQAFHHLGLAARGIPQTFEWRSRKKGGAIFWTEVKMRRADIIGEERIIVTVRDVSSRKEAEEALRQNEEILKVLMEAMPAGVGWSDENGTIQYCNEYLKGCLQEWFGCIPGEVPTIDALMQHALPDPAYRAKIQQTWSGNIAANPRGEPVPPIEATVTCRDGSLRHLFINTRLVHDRILFIFTDITKWEAMQAEILKAQKLESLGVLAGGIAHDFNNILTGILGNLSFAGLILDGSHQARRPLEQAEKASLRAAELAHQLLTFARGGQPVKKAVSVASLVQESLGLALHGSNVRSEVRIPARVHAIEADEGQMNQAFNNVIINAIQAMPEGGTLTVKAENVTLEHQNVAGLRAGQYVKLSFSDEGVGIPHEDRQRIFDPYFTTKAGGTGLGLASVHSILSKHDGKIEVDSAIGKGTTFTFYLPSTGRPCSDAQCSPPPLPQSVETGRRAILIMDDEESIRTLAAEILEYLGYEVKSCGNGQEAVNCYKEAAESGAPFFAAIMDLTVPAGMGGREAAQQILAFDPAARLIVSSGYSNDPVMAQYGDHGFCAAVIKPYRAGELQQAIGVAAKASGSEANQA